MKKFLALYIGSASQAGKAAVTLSDETRAEGMAAWGAWMAQHRAVIVDAGGPLGATRKASIAGISDMRNAITGYVIVEAQSHEAAARLFERHPHFAIFPGDSVEIIECLPMPGG
jgi:hypothetical protein